jgi:hypothetical protein
MFQLPDSKYFNPMDCLMANIAVALSPRLALKIFKILRYIKCLDTPGVLNVNEKKLITQFGRKPRDKSFEPN